MKNLPSTKDLALIAATLAYPDRLSNTPASLADDAYQIWMECEKKLEEIRKAPPILPQFKRPPFPVTLKDALGWWLPDVESTALAKNWRDFSSDYEKSLKSRRKPMHRIIPTPAYPYPNGRPLPTPTEDLSEDAFEWWGQAFLKWREKHISNVRAEAGRASGKARREQKAKTEKTS